MRKFLLATVAGLGIAAGSTAALAEDVADTMYGSNNEDSGQAAPAPGTSGWPGCPCADPLHETPLVAGFPFGCTGCVGVLQPIIFRKPERTTASRSRRRASPPSYGVLEKPSPVQRAPWTGASDAGGMTPGGRTGAQALQALRMAWRNVSGSGTPGSFSATWPLEITSSVAAR